MANTGRTTTKWIRFCVDAVDGTPYEIPVDSISPVGFTYDETELTAWQDAVKGYLSNHPDAPIDITGPFDTSGLVARAASGLAPALSGSHTVLAPKSAVTNALPGNLWIGFGIRAYWEAGNPAWGVIDSDNVNYGYILTKYTVEGEKYSARFVPTPGTEPGWGIVIIS
jgi:hypothetical protein